MSALPLNGFKVIDLTAHRAGPTAVRQLADWGADVIKIEMPGEHTDATGSRRDGPDFQNLHRNKRSLSLDLKTPEGKKIFFQLAAKADVVVENFRSTVKHRLGVDYEAVKKINPRIVYGSISGFGQDGPYEGRPGVDQIAQGMGGLMSITGLPGQGPVRVGIAINDTSAGILLANGITLALLARERTGEGQWAHTSLLEAQIFMLDFQASRYTMKGEVAKQEGNFHPTSPGTGMFQTADGYINIAASGDNLWKRFCEVAGDKGAAREGRGLVEDRARAVARHDLGADRGEAGARKLQMRPGERDADDRDREPERQDQMDDRQPPAGEHKPEDVTEDAEHTRI